LPSWAILVVADAANARAGPLVARGAAGAAALG